MARICRTGIVISAMLCLAASAFAQWSLLNPPHHPDARYQGSMAYDSFRDRHVLFGGNLNDQSPFGDTWEFDGSDWTLKSVSGPAPRCAEGMVFDSARKVVVLYGGNVSTYSTFFDDTWEWDGISWKQIATVGPGARAQMSMAYDSARQKVVLFGGYGFGNSLKGDTWEWDGTRWSQMSPAGATPSARGQASMAYDSVSGLCLLYGGGNINDGNSIQNDTWGWDGSRWVKIFHGEAPAKQAHALLYDPVRRRTVLYGGNIGRDAPVTSDLWEFDGVQWREISGEPGPHGLNLPMFDYDSKRNQYLLFGGATPYANTYFSNTWTWSPPAGRLSTLTFGQVSASGGDDLTATITVSQAASNAPVKISSSNSLLTFPPSILVPPGETSVSFVVHTHVVTSQQVATLYASLDNESISANITLSPPSGGRN
jgi:hypothetical protein